MMATSLRSMPRLMTIRPMPRPRMPRMEMLRTRLSRLVTEEKPRRVKLKTTSSAIVISSTICSCDGFFSSCPNRLPIAPRSLSADASNAMAIAPPRNFFVLAGYPPRLATSCPGAAFQASPNRRRVLYMLGLAYLSRRAPTPRGDRKFASLMTPEGASGTRSQPKRDIRTACTGDRPERYDRSPIKAVVRVIVASQPFRIFLSSVTRRPWRAGRRAK